MFFFCAFNLLYAQKTPRIYLEGFGGGSSTGTVKVRVYNSSYDSTFVFDAANETSNRAYLSPPAGMYNISIENSSNGRVFHNICQMGNVCNPDYMRQNMCGYAADNTGVYDSQIGTSTGATKVVYQNLNVVSKLNYQNKCVTRFSDLGGDYELGAIYITLIIDERNQCRTMNYVRPVVTTNAQMVNDSTYQIAANSTLKLGASCSSVITGYKAEWGTTGLDSLKEVITSNKVYQVRCKDNSTCTTQYRKIYVNTFTGCSLSNVNSSITGIAINNDYEGNVFIEIFAPIPTGTVNGSISYTNLGLSSVSGSATFSQSNYDLTTKAYHINTGIFCSGSFSNPEIRNGKISAKINSEQNYNVNYSYTSYGYFDNAGRRPQGMSITYSPCFDGKTTVFANTEPKGDEHYITSKVMAQKFRQIYPTVGSDILPFVAINHYWFPTEAREYCCDRTSGAIASIGQLTVGQQYTYRVIGLKGESQGDYIDVSFTPSCPNPQISATKSLVCYGESSTLTVNGCTGNICWETGQTTQSIVVKPTMTSTYKVACTTTEGDFSSATFIVKVLNNNAVVSIISNKPDNTILPNENIVLTASGCTDGQIIWVNGFTGSTQIVNPSRTTEYFAYCDIGGCRSSISTIKVNVIPPTPSVISNNAEFCETASNNVILSASGCNGTYFWSNGATTDIIQVPAQTATYWVVCRIGGIDSEKKYIKLKY